MTHEPVGFLSGTFRGAQQRWATVDKEGFAIVSTFKRLEYLLWNGVHIYTDHRNLAYIFDPEACVSSVAKTTAQRFRICCLLTHICVGVAIRFPPRNIEGFVAAFGCVLRDAFKPIAVHVLK